MPDPSLRLDALLRPQSVAIIGASTNPNKVGGIPVSMLLKLGYEGRIIPVNPQAREVQGLPAVASILDAVGPVDLAIICVPEDQAAAMLTECGRAGVAAAIMFTSGFAEMGSAGQQAQQELAAIAGSSGITLLGPNCLGAMNIRSRMFATFSPAPRAGVPPEGGIGLVSQSGAFGAYAYTLARKNHLGLSHWVTTGNEAGVQAADVIEWMAQDDEMSHTASLAGEDAVFDAVFNECAAIRAYTIEEFFRYGQMFATSSLPANEAVAIVTVSGGVGTLMADRAEELGLDLPAFTDAEGAVLKAMVPFCSTINPVDVTGQVTGNPDLLPAACRLAVDSGRYGAVSLFIAAGAFSPPVWPMLEQCVRTLTSRKGMAATVAGVMGDDQRRTLAAMGCLVFEEPTHAIEAIAVMRRYVRARDAAGEFETGGGQIEPLPRGGALNEAESLAFVQSGGMQAAPFGVAASGDEAAALAAGFNEPVVVKVLSRDLMHKSDVGGVRLNMRTPEDAGAAFDSIRANVARLAPQARFEGVLVARMVKPVIECMAGARLDPVFGPIVAFGLGGTEVEWLNRVAVATAPVSPARVKALLGQLGILQRLDGWRGGPVISPEPLIAAICSMGHLAAAAGSRLVSIEVNPLMVTPDGVFAADAVVQLT